jgi:GNAT superfamily N-acetyltransferase
MVRSWLHDAKHRIQEQATTMHPVYAEPRQRAQLWALLEATWPGLCARFELADWHGWPVDAVSTPFVARAGGRIVSHVGLLELPVRLGGSDRVIAGLHGVCTHPEARGRGCFRAAMEQAMAHLEARYPAAKLSTELPGLYEPFGFRAVPQHRFRLPLEGPGGGTVHPVSEAELPWLQALLAEREPLSERFAARDPGWLLGIDGVLAAGGLDVFQRVPALDLAVCWERQEGALRIDQIIARRLPPLEALLAHCPWPFRGVELRFAPDKLAPQAEPVPWPPGEVLMVWGDWPELPPFCVPPLEAH